MEPIERRQRLDSLRTFFRLSFMYSQGDRDLQRLMFRYAAVISPNNDVPKYTSDTFPNFEVPNKHKHLSRYASVENNLVTEWGIMKDCFDRNPARNPGAVKDEIIQKILKGTIGKDVYYMENNREGRNPAEYRSPDDKDDQHASLFRKYGMGGDSTGHEIFNTMFVDITKELINNYPDYKKDFENLVDKWEHIHEGYKYVPSESNSQF